MNNSLRILALISMFFSFGLSTSVSASLVMESYISGIATPDSIGGYEMVALDGGLLSFDDKYGNPANMTLSTADSESWWVNGENSDYDIYTTSLHLIEITLPEKTLAFSLNVGANIGASAWLTAEEIYSDGTAGTGINPREYFGLSPTNTPGFGIYADNTGGNCSYISSVTIDPHLVWGFGNFSVSQGDCATVPEPSVIALFATGLFAMVMIRRRKQF